MKNIKHFIYEKHKIPHASAHIRHAHAAVSASEAFPARPAGSVPRPMPHQRSLARLLGREAAYRGYENPRQAATDALARLGLSNKPPPWEHRVGALRAIANAMHSQGRGDASNRTNQRDTTSPPGSQHSVGEGVGVVAPRRQASGGRTTYEEEAPVDAEESMERSRVRSRSREAVARPGARQRPGGSTAACRNPSAQPSEATEVVSKTAPVGHPVRWTGMPPFEEAGLRPCRVSGLEKCLQRSKGAAGAAQGSRPSERQPVEKSSPSAGHEAPRPYPPSGYKRFAAPPDVQPEHVVTRWTASAYANEAQACEENDEKIPPWRKGKCFQARH